MHMPLLQYSAFGPATMTPYVKTLTEISYRATVITHSLGSLGSVCSSDSDGCYLLPPGVVELKILTYLVKGRWNQCFSL